MIIEVCAESYEYAMKVEKAGADRIELCRDLYLDGLTPDYESAKRTIDSLNIPVFILIRPREGDFVYSNKEFELMKRDIAKFKEMGCKGIVSGVLNSDKSIDIKRTKELIELSKPLSFTFHRALDEVANPKEALEQLINLGVERVLTSGQKPSAEEGLSLLKKLNEIANGKITILAGGGINAQNAVKFKEAGLKEIHASASITINQDDSLFCLPQTVSDTNTIKDILDAI